MATAEWKKENIEKVRKYRREWYKRNSSKEIVRVIKRRVVAKAYLQKLKDGLTCSHCPEDDNRCLDFHHIRGKKKLDVSKMAHYGYSIATLKKEIAKCIVLCANCHRKETLK